VAVNKKEKIIEVEMVRGKSADQRCWVAEAEVLDMEDKGWKKTGRTRSIQI
jgi:hypothetical protein